MESYIDDLLRFHPPVVLQTVVYVFLLSVAIRFIAKLWQKAIVKGIVWMVVILVLVSLVLKPTETHQTIEVLSHKILGSETRPTEQDHYYRRVNDRTRWKDKPDDTGNSFN